MISHLHVVMIHPQANKIAMNYIEERMKVNFLISSGHCPLIYALNYNNNQCVQSRLVHHASRLQFTVTINYHFIPSRFVVKKNPYCKQLLLTAILLSSSNFSNLLFNSCDRKTISDACLSICPRTAGSSLDSWCIILSSWFLACVASSNCDKIPSILQMPNVNQTVLHQSVKTSWFLSVLSDFLFSGAVYRLSYLLIYWVINWSNLIDTAILIIINWHMDWVNSNCN